MIDLEPQKNSAHEPKADSARTSQLVILVLLAGSAVVLGLWIHAPWPAIVALGFFCVELLSITRQSHLSRWSLRILWGSTILLPIASILADKDFTDTGFCTALAWLNAIAVWHVIRSHSGFSSSLPLRRLAYTWAFLGSISWLWASYSHNQPLVFYLGIPVNLWLLFLCKRHLALKDIGIQVANTAILVLVGLPIADWLVRPQYQMDPNPDPRRKYFLYENAMKNPGGFRSWCHYGARQWVAAERTFYLIDSKADPRYRLRPNSKGRLYNSYVSINSKGFRGREIAENKGDAYRIVALGESTTFGVTLNEEDKPWPEILESLINERLKPQRPVEIINAGVPGYSLKHNLKRLQSEILPLKPDMIISYHGVNGFHLLDSAFPKTIFANPPTYEERPIKLLADSEYRLKLLLFKKREMKVSNPPETLRSSRPSGFVDPENTPYADAYRELIRVTHASGIRLVLADYSMAVNEKSDPRIGEFYREWWPDVFWHVRANVLHSDLLKKLAAKHPEVSLIQTCPVLDGIHEKFMDLVHFTQEGDQAMAEIMFQGIKPVLEKDLPGPPLAASPQ